MRLWQRNQASARAAGERVCHMRSCRAARGVHVRGSGTNEVEGKGVGGETRYGNSAVFAKAKAAVRRMPFVLRVHGAVCCRR